jgi:predicted membrane protein
MHKRQNLAPVIWGLVILTIGLGYAGNIIGLWNNFTMFISGWWILLFIIIPSGCGIVTHGPRPVNTVVFIVGIMLFAAKRTNIAVLSKLTLPVIIIAVGLIIIFKSKAFNHRTSEQLHSDFIPNYTTVFSGKDIRINSGEVFNGCKMTAVFGGLLLDLRNAVINTDIEIYVESTFGGVELFLPNEVNVNTTNLMTVFAGIDNKFKTSYPGKPTITVSGKCTFAGIDIK